MSHKQYKGFEPKWVKTPAPANSYRSIFRWGDPEFFKFPKESLYKMMKEVFKLTDEASRSRQILIICGATVSSIDGQNGLQRSRNLICSLIRSATPVALGQPMIERPPSARGPNSMRPWNQATGLPSTMILAMRSGMSSIRRHTGLLG